MANEILVTPEEMRQRAKMIRSLEEYDRGIMWHLTMLVQTLTIAWNSPSQAAFVEKYMSMQPAVESFHQAVKEFAALMEEHADRMEKVDQDMAGRINKLG